jgi:DNA polymerase I-like protein with 3'-5' exonuclease and polymerase domains
MFKSGSSKDLFYCVEQKSTVVYYLISKYTKRDIARIANGEQPLDPTINNVNSIGILTKDYIIAGLKRMRVTGQVKAFGNISKIQKLMDFQSYCTMYNFRSSDIEQDTTSYDMDGCRKVFKARDKNLEYQYSKLDNGTLSLIGVDLVSGTSVEQWPTAVKLSQKGFEFTDVDSMVQKHISVSTIKKVTYQTLCDSLDMTWFEEDGVRKKEYRAIETVEEFETLIMAPLVHAIVEAHRRGEELLLSIDTETTGLNICDLARDNPDKDHCVAIPIAWEDNKAFVIFTDMEHFDSIDNEYVMKRLEPIIKSMPYHLKDDKPFSERIEEPIEIQLYTSVKKKEKKKMAAFMEAFGGISTDESNDEFDFTPGERVIIYRSWVNLTGHNVIYDGKVFYDFGVLPYFDDDTLQMAFDISPKSVRGNNKLKSLTRYFFGHETPELTDVLGKGNEDKYRYLSDKLVAIIYGCADADYSRLVHHELRALMTDKMYAQYKKQDVPMLNALYVSEYHGLKTIGVEVKKLAQQSQENLTILKEFMYTYVGKIVYMIQKRDSIEKAYKVGVYSKEERDGLLAQISKNMPPDSELRFEFEVKASDIRYVMYNILGYPIKAYTAGDVNGNNKLPKTDKYVMQKLMSEKLTDDEIKKGYNRGWTLEKSILVSGASYKEYEKLLEAKQFKKAKAMELINADEFNHCKYPLAIVLSQYAVLNKEFTSYFKPMLEMNLEDKIFNGYSLARIETRRIMNASQTMKGSLKKVIRSFGDDWYCCDFDMAQAEYRVMASEAGLTEIIEKIRDPEKDYHTETASLVHQIPAYLVDKKTRKGTKCIGFGVPYGLSDRSLCEKLFGTVNEDTMFQTRMMLQVWCDANQPIVDKLNEKRAEALTPRDISLDLRNFLDMWERDLVFDSRGKLLSRDYKLDASGNRIPKPVGFVTNSKGFYRVFDLSDMTRSKRSTIERAAGNYPIQSDAAEIFRIILLRFKRLCEDYGIADKVVWHMLIHDELLCSVHKSVHPFLLYKIIKQACMVTFPGHTNYFVGINLGKTWGDCKNDAWEAPVNFVSRIIKRYDAGEFTEAWVDEPDEYVKPYMIQYFDDRIGEVLHEIQPNMDNEPINIPLILEKFENYTVRGYVDSYDQNRDVPDLTKEESKDKDLALYHSNAIWVTRLETYLLGHFPEGKEMIGQDGEPCVLAKGEFKKQTINLDLVDLIDEDEDDTTDSYWSFDESEYESSLGVDFSDSDYAEGDDGLEIVDNLNARTVATMIKTKVEFHNIRNTANQIIIKVNSNEEMTKCQVILKDYVYERGKSVLFKTPIGLQRWLKIKESAPLKEVDDLLSKG